MDRAEDVWEELATTTHQDHVIAHVIGTTPVGYIVLGDATHVLLDIGFIWKIYSDAEMGLLPHPVAATELDVSDALLTQMKTDIDVLLREEIGGEPLTSFSPLSCRCAITNVQVLSQGDLRKIVLAGEGGNIEIQTSLISDTVRVSEREA